MRHLAVAAVAAMVLAGPAHAEDANQAYLGVFVETSVMKFAGMKMPEMPKIEGLPAGIKLPPMPGQPTRRLTVRLWSPGPAPENAAAVLTVPEGVKLGPKLNLEIARPAEIKARMEGRGPGETGKVEIPEFTIKRYWGSSPTVREGQPEVIQFGGLTEEQKAAMRAAQEKAAKQGGGVGDLYYKPDWTTAYWPGRQRNDVEEDATLLGTYSLATTYTGNVELPVPASVSVLAPLEITAPDLGEKILLDAAIAFRWNALPGILGYHARIIGMQGKTTMIIWDSSEIKPQREINWDYMQMAEVAALVKTKEAMAPDRVEMTIPKSIFQGCDMVMMQMIGYGPGAATAAGNPLPRLQTKTTLSVMLHGGRMPTMAPGAPGKDGAEE